MEVVFWILKWIIGPIVGILIGIAFKAPVERLLLPAISKYFAVKGDITGIWKATFYFGDKNESFVEIIELKTLFGQIVGRVVPHELNHAAAGVVSHKKPLRVQGTVKDNRFFSGIWFHPNRISHHQGTFDLIFRIEGTEMHGCWLGYSETTNNIVTGIWTWERMDT